MLAHRFQRNEGFTLIEVLVVCLIVALLAAIALPVFLGQQKKGQDASAKSNARNLVSQIESCKASTDDYTLCDTAAELGTTGLAYGSAAGQVQVTGSSADGYSVVATSRNAGHTFTITRDNTATPPITRTCSNAGDGGCKADGTW